MDFSPAGVEWRAEDTCGLFAFEHPVAIYSNIFLVVDTRPPHSSVSFAYRAGHEQIPPRPR